MKIKSLAYSPWMLAADNNITINNNYPPQQQGQNNQGNQGNQGNQSNQGGQGPSGNNQSYGTDTPPGTYYQSNPHGGMDTVYTTGDKKPYIVDNNNNNMQQPIIEPNVYPPTNPAPKPPIRTN